ncbi:hypothetical protein [Streptomyces sp. S584]|uniref:hypothetical protein n=1 Tax=Streptomyces sp. S584 TaxID=3096010 RepID=UPI002AFE248F|nr:hypothetical protein [Streptomyces sp. S584]
MDSPREADSTPDTPFDVLRCEERRRGIRQRRTRTAARRTARTRLLHLDVSEEELELRRSAWTEPPARYGRGYGALYQDQITQADTGCDFAFLARQGEVLGRHAAGLCGRKGDGDGGDDLVDVTGCLGCDLLTGCRELPGGVLYETSAWVVNHVVGPMNLGTLIVGPQDHIVAVADPDDTAAAELGPLARADLRLHVVARPRRA